MAPAAAGRGRTRTRVRWAANVSGMAHYRSSSRDFQGAFPVTGDTCRCQAGCLWLRGGPPGRLAASLHPVPSDRMRPYVRLLILALLIAPPASAGAQAPDDELVIIDASR